MRISAIPGSRYYAPPLMARAVIYLNGILISNVVEASEDDGWVVAVSVQDNGTTSPHPSSPVGVRCRKWSGVVQIVLRPLDQRDNEPDVIHSRWIIPSPDRRSDAQPNRD